MSGDRQQRLALLRAGTVKRIHVNRLSIGTGAPPITVQTSAGSLATRRVEIKGPSVMVYQPAAPLSCGAKVWVETYAEVALDEQHAETLPDGL